jgi:hypothetical protein
LSRGYQLCLLHPGQTHHFAQQRGLQAKTDQGVTLSGLLFAQEDCNKWSGQFCFFVPWHVKNAHKQVALLTLLL